MYGEQINIYRSFFRGREDVFATRWEKNGKSGYMPAYSFDPYMYKLHRIKGGTFQNYTGKQYQSLTDEQISKHLNGEQLVGIYPLLKDNSSWFIVADFDEKNWQDECKQCIKTFEEKGIPAYLGIPPLYPIFQHNITLSNFAIQSYNKDMQNKSEKTNEWQFVAFRLL